MLATAKIVAKNSSNRLCTVKHGGQGGTWLSNGKSGEASLGHSERELYGRQNAMAL
jgi:hypothetical protein